MELGQNQTAPDSEQGNPYLHRPLVIGATWTIRIEPLAATNRDG
jgi:hypothetical protein